MNRGRWLPVTLEKPATPAVWEEGSTTAHLVPHPQGGRALVVMTQLPPNLSDLSLDMLPGVIATITTQMASLVGHAEETQYPIGVSWAPR